MAALKWAPTFLRLLLMEGEDSAGHVSEQGDIRLTVPHIMKGNLFVLLTLFSKRSSMSDHLHPAVE